MQHLVPLPYLLNVTMALRLAMHACYRASVDTCDVDQARRGNSMGRAEHFVETRFGPFGVRAPRHYKQLDNDFLAAGLESDVVFVTVAGPQAG